MRKTYKVTIELTYENIQNEQELKKAIRDEACSWVDSGSFDNEGVLASDTPLGEFVKSIVEIK